MEDKKQEVSQKVPKNKTKVDVIFTIIFLVFLIPFYFFEDIRLILGGVIFIVLAAKQILFDSNLVFWMGNKKENLFVYSFFIGFLLLILGIISLSASVLLPNQLNLFLLIFLTSGLCIAVLISTLWSLFKAGEKILSILTFVAPIILSSLLVVGPLIDSINKEGISSGLFYFETIIFVALVLWYLSIFVRSIFESLIFFTGFKRKMMERTSFHLHLAITLLILIGGFFYLKYVSTDDLKDLLILLGVILSIWLTISQDRS